MSSRLRMDFKLDPENPDRLQCRSPRSRNAIGAMFTSEYITNFFSLELGPYFLL